jgi:hypothetical protein
MDVACDCTVPAAPIKKIFFGFADDAWLELPDATIHAGNVQWRRGRWKKWSA